MSLDETRSFPICHLEFTTPKKQRAQLFETGRSLYEALSAEPNLRDILGLVERCLNQKPEQADVVHDLLGFLATQMIEMNNKKQAETKAFLEWLEAIIGAKVESLKNKTRIAAYYEGDLGPV